jgi:LmbE family N-acetylglucosaminyl deacetylase
MPMDGVEETQGLISMLPFAPAFPARRAPRILCIGAHSDDLEIGCGGTLLELAERYPKAHVRWAVMTGAGERATEARRSANAILRAYRSSEVSVAAFRDGFLPQAYGEVKDFFEELKRGEYPDLIFSHTLQDRHQDHRLLAELTWNTWRNATILEFEIPKYEGDLGAPNVFVPLSARNARRKVRHLMTHFKTQRARSWFTPELFEGHMRLRGLECVAPSGMAEAFHGRKICL